MLLTRNSRSPRKLRQVRKPAPQGRPRRPQQAGHSALPPSCSPLLMPSMDTHREPRPAAKTPDTVSDPGSIGTELEENGRSAGLERRTEIERAQAAQERPRCLFVESNGCDVGGGRRD